MDKEELIGCAGILGILGLLCLVIYSGAKSATENNKYDRDMWNRNCQYIHLTEAKRTVTFEGMTLKAISMPHDGEAQWFCPVIIKD